MSKLDKNILINRTKLVSALKDIYPNDVTKINMLMMAYDINIPSIILSRTFNNELENQCINEIESKLGFKNSIASNIVNEWCDILGLKVDNNHDTKGKDNAKNNKVYYLEHFIDYEECTEDDDGFDMTVHYMQWWEEFCKSKNVSPDVIMDIKIIRYITNYDVNELESCNINKKNVNCKVKVKLDADSLFFYTDADSFIIPDSTKRGYFEGLMELQFIKGLDKFDISYNRRLSRLFYDCYGLTRLDLSMWNTSNLEYMVDMFLGCVSLESINVSTWNVSKVRDMSGMFCDCPIKSINVSLWNTKNVEKMNHMFCNCQNLEMIDVSKWNVRNVEDMESMFFNCVSLKNVDTSLWNLKSDVNNDDMFLIEDDIGW